MQHTNSNHLHKQNKPRKSSNGKREPAAGSTRPFIWSIVGDVVHQIDALRAKLSVQRFVPKRSHIERGVMSVASETILVSSVHRHSGITTPHNPTLCWWFTLRSLAARAMFLVFIVILRELKMHVANEFLVARTVTYSPLHSIFYCSTSGAWTWHADKQNIQWIQVLIWMLPGTWGQGMLYFALPLCHIHDALFHSAAFAEKQWSQIPGENLRLMMTVLLLNQRNNHWHWILFTRMIFDLYLSICIQALIKYCGHSSAGCLIVLLRFFAT